MQLVGSNPCDVCVSQQFLLHDPVDLPAELCERADLVLPGQLLVVAHKAVDQLLEEEIIHRRSVQAFIWEKCNYGDTGKPRKKLTKGRN